MIASIQGEVVHKSFDSIVVSVNGVGFSIFVSNEMVEKTKIGDFVTLFTQLIVRENSLTLYGFEREVERKYFNLLLDVSGIGPKSSLMTISTLSIDAINRAVSAEQSEIFAQVPGIGKKTAQKIAIHLQGKIHVDEIGGVGASFADVDVDVVAALTALGYSIIDAQAAIQSIPRDASDDLEERIRLALQFFS